MSDRTIMQEQEHRAIHDAWCGLIGRGVIWLSALIAILPGVANADAGAVRASKRDENGQVTVFTDPTPLRAGPVDLSVFVQDAGTGQPILESSIDIEVTPRGRSSEKIHLPATRAAASNKLFQAAHFNLPHAGWWTFAVVVRRPTDSMDLRFELEAADSLPTWRSLWLWFGWPFFVVALFAVSRLSPRRRREPARLRTTIGLGGWA